MAENTCILIIEENDGLLHGLETSKTHDILSLFQNM